jgi:GNAT superfamily N-acetyltransferase
MTQFRIRSATEEDVPLILTFILDLARYEKLEHEVVATAETLRATLFGQPRFAEVLFGEEDGQAVAFALFFHNYSTFVGRPGLYLEDVFVRPEFRGRGNGKAMLARLASIAVERNCGRFEWAVLDWNTPAITFYKSLGARAVDEWTIFRMTGAALRNLAAQNQRT